MPESNSGLGEGHFGLAGAIWAAAAQSRRVRPIGCTALLSGRHHLGGCGTISYGATHWGKQAAWCGHRYLPSGRGFLLSFFWVGRTWTKRLFRPVRVKDKKRKAKLHNIGEDAPLAHELRGERLPCPSPFRCPCILGGVGCAVQHIVSSLRS